MTARTVLRFTSAFLAALFLSATAHAQLFRAYLASNGNDANACTLPAPCRLLPAALNAVANGGEIWMLDSANFNTATVTIGKSVTILAVPGAVGSVLAIGGPAISITANSLTVSLRNLVLAPLSGGGGTKGISMTGASTLTIEHSLIANLPGDAVYVLGTGTLKITNTIIRNNGAYAVWLENGASAGISGTQMLANTNGGVYARSSTATTTTASVSDSIVSGGSVGTWASTTIAGGATKVFVTRCTIESVDFAIGSETNNLGTATAVVSYSTIVNNGYSRYQLGTGASYRTLGNNHITDNTATSGTFTPVALQ